jgi:hypothetical protein
MERFAEKTKLRNKFCFQYEGEESWTQPGMCAFGRLNGGLDLLEMLFLYATSFLQIRQDMGT